MCSWFESLKFRTRLATWRGSSWKVPVFGNWKRIVQNILQTYLSLDFNTLGMLLPGNLLSQNSSESFHFSGSRNPMDHLLSWSPSQQEKMENMYAGNWNEEITSPYPLPEVQTNLTSMVNVRHPISIQSKKPQTNHSGKSQTEWWRVANRSSRSPYVHSITHYLHS